MEGWNDGGRQNTDESRGNDKRKNGMLEKKEEAREVQTKRNRRAITKARSLPAVNLARYENTKEEGFI